MSSNTLKQRIHAIGTCWIAKQSLDHLEAIRLHELKAVLELMPPQSNVLEVGAGTGWQARALAEHGHNVSAVELASRNYREAPVWPVTEYDGEHLPFPPDSFDLVFSSNVLEHIPKLQEFQQELHRVLKPGGSAIHIVPSSTWSLWTNLTTLLKQWRVAQPHGEHASNATAEILQFRRRAWEGLFTASGWSVIAQKPIRLFYSGCSIMDRRLSIPSRVKLSYLLGGSCRLFILRPTANRPDQA